MEKGRKIYVVKDAVTKEIKGIFSSKTNADKHHREYRVTEIHVMQ